MEKTNLLNHKKIISQTKLLEEIHKLKQNNQKIVFTNGCFDIIHPGHVDLLAKAKSLGDILILALNTDASVKRLGKGDARPFNCFEARAFVVAHLESVDFVTCFDDDTPLALIEMIIPHVLVKGGDWNLNTIVGRECVEKNGGKVQAIELVEGFSTTNLAEKIKSLIQKGLV